MAEEKSSLAEVQEAPASEAASTEKENSPSASVEIQTDVTAPPKIPKLRIRDTKGAKRAEICFRYLAGRLENEKNDQYKYYYYCRLLENEEMIRSALKYYIDEVLDSPIYAYNTDDAELLEQLEELLKRIDMPEEDSWEDEAMEFSKMDATDKELINAAEEYLLYRYGVSPV
ncbi:unnamed protein product [Gongylonema pulchrum]|uniref:RGS domain-containing protein n=1 Tax=Gongylonema pulchrum TaxID=637853 RepID=A0A183DJP5_9BILA|nr:unnamed protein product [Gongylonema pulchrum]